MSKFPNTLAVLLIVIVSSAGPVFAQDIKAGAKVFKKCAACHAVGEGARKKIGPHLNGLFKRVAGTSEGFKYSKAMKAAGQNGLVWNAETIDQFVAKPRAMIKKTKMSFSGIRKEKDRQNLIAFLNQYSEKPEVAVTAPRVDTSSANEHEAKPEQKTVLAKDVAVPKHGVFHLGREALVDEIQAWDIDVRPDGVGLPAGRGTVAQGETLYNENCVVCHGDFGEGIDRWPVLAGGHDTLTDDRPVKTVGSYWPYLSTVYDYIRRAMPFGNARSISDDEVYALTAYVLFLNDIVTDENFELSNENFSDIQLPNEENFIPDNRQEEAHYKAGAEPCMNNCKAGVAKIIMRARVLDVTPDNQDDDVGAM